MRGTQLHDPVTYRHRLVRTLKGNIDSPKKENMDVISERDAIATLREHTKWIDLATPLVAGTKGRAFIEPRSGNILPARSASSGPAVNLRNASLLSRVSEVYRSHPLLPPLSRSAIFMVYYR